MARPPQKKAKFSFIVPVISFKVYILVNYPNCEATPLGQKLVKTEIVDTDDAFAWSLTHGCLGLIAFIVPPTHDTIAHECIHLSADILKFHGIKANAGGELTALLSDYLVGRTTQGLTKRGYQIKAR